MILSEKLARIQLTIVNNISPLKFLKILEHYGSASAYLKNQSTAKFKFFSDGEQLHKDAGYEIDINKTVVYGEETYPELLSQIADPPIAIKFAGDLSLLNSAKIVSMVGTRKNSEYGRNCAVKFAGELALEGFTVVSGMAIGIDTIVHNAVLAAGGRTIAVLPGDIDNPYPKSNLGLFREISKRGLVISEVCRDTDLQKYVFVKRNRIIAGLAKACVVVEAPLKSGGLITTELALNYNREVYAVPSPVFSESGAGCNKLITEGKAKLLNNSAELLEDLRIEKSTRRTGLPEAEQMVINCLQSGEGSFDSVSKSAKIASPELCRLLLEMEFKRLIAKSLNGNYTLL